MYHFIINPASRSGKGLAIWEQKVEPALNRFHIEYKAHISDKKGAVTTLAKQITKDSEKDQIIVVLGGDGTLNEVLQGICDFSKVILGYIPTGSSNDFSRDLNIPTDPVKALELILGATAPSAIDIGKTTLPDGTVRYFAVSSGFGYDAAVCAGANDSGLKVVLNKLGLGKLVYLGIALKQLIAAVPTEVDMTVGEETLHISDFLLNACMNHRYEGGGFKFCPSASDNDGLLDTCTVGGLSKPAMLRALPTAFKGNHLKFKGIDSYRGATIHLKSVVPLWVHTDGEVLGQYDEVTVTCLKQVLRIYKPTV